MKYDKNSRYTGISFYSSSKKTSLHFHSLWRSSSLSQKYSFIHPFPYRGCHHPLLHPCNRYYFTSGAVCVVKGPQLFNGAFFDLGYVQRLRSDLCQVFLFFCIRLHDVDKRNILLFRFFHLCNFFEFDVMVLHWRDVLPWVGNLCGAHRRLLNWNVVSERDLFPSSFLLLSLFCLSFRF